MNGFDPTHRAWMEYRYHATTLEFELQISQLERERDVLAAELKQTQGERDCALAGLAQYGKTFDEVCRSLDILHRILFCGAQLRLRLMAEIERLEGNNKWLT